MMQCKIIFGEKKRVRVPKFTGSVINIPTTFGGIYSFGWTEGSFEDFPTKLNWCMLALKQIYLGKIVGLDSLDFVDYAKRFERVLKGIYPTMEKVDIDGKAVDGMDSLQSIDFETVTSVFFCDKALSNFLKYPESKLIIEENNDSQKA